MAQPRDTWGCGAVGSYYQPAGADRGVCRRLRVADRDDVARAPAVVVDADAAQGGGPGRNARDGVESRQFAESGGGMSTAPVAVTDRAYVPAQLRPRCTPERSRRTTTSRSHDRGDRAC